MNSKLPEFLRRMAGRSGPFSMHNCGLFLADWVMVAREVADPAAEYRGKFKSQTDFEVDGPPGGVLRLVGNLARRAGLGMTLDPIVGDIGVIVPLAEQGPTGAIRIDNGWVFLGNKTGLVMVGEPRVAAAWRV